MSYFSELVAEEGAQHQVEGEYRNLVDTAAQLEGGDLHNFAVVASGGHLLPWGRLDWPRGEG